VHTALARIAGGGPVRFDRFQADALYAADGFYATGGAAGRGGDFTTAVETGIDFAVSVALELDRAWRAADEPSRFVVVEGGSGVGSLCASVFDIGPMCRDALRWVMVEPSDVQRMAALARLSAEVFPGMEELPVGEARDIAHMRLDEPVDFVIANELLDNLPARIVRRGDGWQEMFVGLDGQSPCEVWRPLDESASRRADRHGAELGVGSMFPLVDQAVKWVVTALGLLRQGGSLLVFDYGATTVELGERGRGEWLRTYSGHQRGTHVFEAIGEQDITIDVPFDQLPGGPHLETQRDWLIARGIGLRREELVLGVDAARPDASSLAAIARVQEIDELLDQAGMGLFTAATWHR
jgi:SAM-dependent MidA family methyltransferase